MSTTASSNVVPPLSEDNVSTTTTTTTTTTTNTAVVATATTVVPAATIVLAEGSIVTRYPGGRLVAVRVHDDLSSTTTMASIDDDDDNGARPQRNSSAASSSSLTPLTSIKNSAASNGDFLGKQVLFPNGATGIVVTHRPPIVFCYIQQQQAEDNNDTDPTSGMVQVMDRMVTVKSSYEGGIVPVDGWGVPIQSAAATAAAAALGGPTSGEEATPPETGSSPKMERAIFSPIPQVANIALINNPMLTGNTMMDTLAPVGRGQNMLLLGSDEARMRHLACDFLQTQKRNKSSPNDSSQQPQTVCVYASTERNGSLALARLQKAGLADTVHFVGHFPSNDDDDNDSGKAATSDIAHAAEAVLIASTACAIGESYALDKGMHSLVVIDNIDLYKTLWDATTRVLVDLFGVDAVVKSDRDGGASSEMRGFYSSLIQRAGQYNKKRGGGSVTLLLLTSIPKPDDTADEADATNVFESADFDQTSDRIKERIRVLVENKIPLTATTLRKINIPIPTVSEGKRRLALQHIDDLISMSDGQVWLDESLAAQGYEPPMDPQRSITRIGIGADTLSRADAPAIRRCAEGVRLELAQAATNSISGTETTVASKKQIRRQQALLLAMYQPAGSGGRRLSESCIVLLAARTGCLDNAVDNGALPSTPEGASVIQSLLKHVQGQNPSVMDEIDQTLGLSDEARNILTESITSYFAL